jgi:Mn2+/Fe2+ NRAMP family transporter
MNETNANSGALATWSNRGKDFLRRTRVTRRRLAVLLAVIGPGLITSNVDNDAGGISVYTQTGAQFGYTMLWSLIPMTIALYVSGEMCARMGVVTGKGLSDLIREEFGFRSTFFVMVAALAVDLCNTVAEFAGIAASMQIFGVSKYISVPLAAVAVWFLVVRGSYSQVEKIFLVACGFYITYIVSAVLAKPDWLLAAKETVAPTLHFSTEYFLMLTALVGTTIAPWQFFYMQAGFVEKHVGAKQYKHARLDVILGSISCMIIVFFIIVCCAATLNKNGLTNITDAAQAATALTTAHVICEGLGFEAGLDRKVKEAPAFYGLYTGLLVVGGGIILLPRAPLFKILILSQVANGVWLPVVLIFILLLINRRDLMGDHTNSWGFNLVAWATSIVMIILTLILVYTAIAQPSGTELSGAWFHWLHWP